MARPGGGLRGGYLYDLVWNTGSGMRTSKSTHDDWPGFGFTTIHYPQGSNNRSTSSRDSVPRQMGAQFSGRHHAIQRYQWRLNAGGAIDTTVHWFFATGRSDPIYAITFDSRPAGSNVVNADTRAPYGDLDFEGATKTEIGGVAWGDKYRFITNCTGGVDANCPWTYNTPNVVPFSRMWSRTADGEMGLAQTTPYADHPAGGDYGGGLLASDCHNKTSATKGADCSVQGESMPQTWMWPFQLNQYEYDQTLESHRLAWGATYGAIGKTSYTSFGETFSGYPFQSYSVLVVIGLKSTNAVMTQVTQIERMARAQLTATEGTVVTMAPGGIERTDTRALARPGYNPTYATYDINAASNRATFILNPVGGAIVNPIFRVIGTTAPTLVTLNGRTLQPDVDVFISYDQASPATAWLTLNGTVSGAVSIHVE